MPMKRCENGHFYDPAQYISCPYCGVPDLDLESTKPAGKAAAENQPTRIRGKPSGGSNDPEGATIGLAFKKLEGIDPVVGWLVCIEGPEIGRDYRIRSEHNFIGRGRNMHIVIESDQMIARERHADLSYDPKSTTFMLMTGAAKGMVYLNTNVVLTPQPLEHGDIIELGESKFMFVPFCGEKWQWK